MTAGRRLPIPSASERHEIERLLVEFEQNWTPTCLASWVARLPEFVSPGRAALLLGLVEIDLRLCWQAGQQPTVEDYLQRFPELGQPETVSVELVVAEYLSRERAGLNPRPAHFAQRFPGIQADLERLIEPVSPASTDSIHLEAPSSHTHRNDLAGDSLHDDETEPRALPESFGRYRILKQLGQGGMGTVYLALDTRLDRQVALKVPRFSPEASPENLQRFSREARATATINHPNLCPLYDVGEYDGVPYLTMPYIEGWSLTRFTTQEKRLSQVAIAATARKIALAVQAAHKVGVIHRDLKPSNIMINKRGEPIVMDFGLARWVKDDREDVRLTRNGSVLGAPVYMSPEQVQGDVEAMGPPCDVYSLGVIIYELLAGKLPFEGANTHAVLAKSLMLEPTPPSKYREDLDPELEAICLKAMAKSIPQRFPSMQALADALGEYLKRRLQETQTGSRTNTPLPQQKLPDERPRHLVRAENAPPRRTDSRLTTEARPSSSLRPDLVAPRRRSPWLAALLVLLGAVVVVAVPILVVLSVVSRAPRGHLLLTLIPIEAEVEIHLDEKLFPRDDVRPAVPLAPGEYQLRITGERYEAVARPVTITADQTERIEIELHPRRPVERLPADAPYPPLPGRVLALATTPAGVGLSGGDDLDVHLWNLDEHRIQGRLVGHQQPVTGVAINRPGDVGVSCAGDQTVRVWNLRTRKQTHRLDGHSDWPRCVALNDIGTRAVSGDDAGRLLAWNTREGRLLRTLDGHAGPVRGVALSPDGRRAVSTGDDGTLRLWDVDSGKQLQLFGASGEPMRSLAWSANGKLAATGGATGTIHLWNLDSGKETILRGHTGLVRGLVFSINGNRLYSAASGPTDSTLRAWDVPRGVFLHAIADPPGGSNALVLASDASTLLSAGDAKVMRGWNPTKKSDRPLPPGPTDLVGQLGRRFTAPAPVAAVSLSTDGSTLLLAGADGGVGVWDVQRGKMRRVLRGHQGAVQAVAISADGRHAASGGADRHVRVWDLQTGTADVLEGHTEAVLALQFLPEGNRLASGSHDRSVIVWNLGTKEPIHKLTGHDQDVRALVAMPDGNQVVSAGLDGQVKIWNVESGQGEGTARVENGGFTCLAALPDGKRWLTGGRDRMVRIWDTSGGKLTLATTLPTLNAPITALAVSGCGRWLSVVSEDRQIQRWDLETLQLQQRNINAHAQRPTAVTFTPDGRSLISAGLDRAIKLWKIPRAEADPAPLAADATETEPARKFTQNEKTTIETAALSPDGKIIVAGGTGEVIHVWDAATGQARPSLAGHKPRVHGLCFLPGGKQLVSGGWDNVARLWNLATGKIERTFEGHTAPVIRVAVSGDGRYLITGSQDRTARIWEVATGRMLRILEGHGNAVWSVALSHDGLLAVTGAYDRSVRWWDLTTGRPLGGYVSPGDIHAVALSPDGKRILAGGKDRTAVLLDVGSGDVIARFPGHTNTIAGVAFSPDGRLVASSGDDRTARVFDVETGREVFRLGGFKAQVWSVSFSPDGKQLVTGSNDPYVALWDLPPSLHPDPVGAMRVLATLPTQLDRMALSPEGTQLVVCGFDNTLRLLDRETGQEIRQFAGLKAQPRYAAFSDDGKTVLATGDKGTSHLWDRATGKALHVLSGHSQTVWMGEFSRDGKQVVTCGSDPYILVHDVASGKILDRIECYPRGAHCLGLLPGGRRAVLGGFSGALGLWDLASGEELQRWAEDRQWRHSTTFSSLEVLPGGQQVVTASYDGAVQLWDVASGRAQQTMTGHTEQLWAVAADSTGEFVASAGKGCEIRVWNATTGTQLAVFEGHTKGVTALRFTSDGRHLLSCSLDGTVREWAVPVR